MCITRLFVSVTNDRLFAKRMIGGHGEGAEPPSRTASQIRFTPFPKTRPLPT